MGNRLQDAKAIFRAFLSAYLEERDVKKTLSLFREDGCSIHVGHREIITDKPAFSRLLEEEIARDPAPYLITWERLEAVLCGENEAGILACFSVCRKDAGQERLHMEMRATARIRFEGERALVRCVHTSVPVMLPLEGGQMPVPLGEHALIGLQKELRGEAFALLNEAIVGGLMGGYAEEGFPLYYINDQMLSCLGYTMQEFLEATGGRMTGCIHPKDRIQAERAAQKCAAQDEICAVRCRMVKKDGGVLWVDIRGRRVVTEDGRPMILCVCVDVSEFVFLQQKQEETARQLQSKNQELEQITNNVPSGVVKCALDGRWDILYAADGFLKILGYTMEEIRWRFASSYTALIYEEDREEIRRRVREKARAGERSFFLEYRMVKKSGEILWVSEHTQLIQENGETHCYCVVTDITETKKINEDLRLLASNIPGGVCTVRMDDDFTLLYGNEGFYQLYGYTPQEMSLEFGNRLIAVIHPEDVARVYDSIERAYESGESSFEFEKRVIRNDRSIVWLLTRGAFIRGGEEISMSCVVIDVTERKEMEEKLQINEERFRIALDQTSNIVFDHDLLTKRTVQSVQAQKIYGLPIVMENVPESLAERGTIVPDSAEEFRALYRRVAEGQPSSSAVVQTVGVNGESLWARITLKTIYNSDGKPVRAVGMVEDITRQRRAELTSLKEEQYRRAILSDAVAYAEINLTKDRFEKLTGSWEAAYAKMDPLRYSDIVRVAAQNTVHPEDREAYLSTVSLPMLREAFEQGNTEVKCEHRRMTAEGRMTWMLLSTHMIRDPETGDLKGIAYLKDIDANKKEQLTLQYQSKRDSLTGLYNKGSSEKIIRGYLRESSADALHAFMIVDVDYFKQINDSFGHMVGDRVLSEMSRKIRASFRYDDVIGRIGGDEFILFMKNAGSRSLVQEKAGMLCELFRTGVGEEMELSCSVGVALYPEDGATFEALYQSADRALYEAKDNGRNQFAFYTNEMRREDWVPRSTTVIDQPAKAERPILSGPMPDVTMDEETCKKAALFDEIKDVLYVSDPFDYELLYINSVVSEQMGFVGSEYHGKKCYQVLQGRDSPCPFCTNAMLKFDEYYVWEHTNALIHRRFILKDKLIWWNGRPARMEFAMDIDDQKFVSHELAEKLTRDNTLLNCVRSMMSAGTLDEAVTAVLETVGRFYSAEHAFVARFHAGERGLQQLYEWCEKGACSHCKLWEDVVLGESSFWSDTLRARRPVVLPDLEELRWSMPEDYQKIIERCVRSLLAVPLEVGGDDICCLGVANLKRWNHGSGFLESVGYFLSNELAKHRLLQQFEFQSGHDTLTGLPNRNSYTRYIDRLQDAAPSSLGVLVADINGLKQINDRFGHKKGDEAVRRMAQILGKHFSSESIFRLSGDEFVVLCADLPYERFLDRIRLVETEFEKESEFSGVSVGYTWADADIDVQSLVNHADELMFIAKRKYYKTDGASSKRHRPKMLLELLKAIEDGWFQIYLQPQVELETGKTVGAEALVRLCHPEQGVIPPARFIPLLEREKLIRFIDFHVFEEVCKLLARWKAEGREKCVISVNFSRLTLLESDLTESLGVLLRQYGVPSSWIEIEITETVGEMERETIAQISRRIKREGFQISLDDFGSKYTSISMLTVMKFDVLKLDRSLVSDLVSNPDNQTVVQCVIDMCRRMKIRIIAEGVETWQQHTLLKQLGCDDAQGYLYSYPVCVKAFEQRMRGTKITPPEQGR